MIQFRLAFNNIVALIKSRNSRRVRVSSVVAIMSRALNVVI